MLEEIVPIGQIALPGAVVLYQEPLVSPPMYPSLFWWIQNADARGKQIDILVKCVGGVVKRAHRSGLRCEAMDRRRRSRVNDVAKNAGRDIMQSREESQRPVVEIFGGQSESVVGDGVARGRVRECGGGAGCVLGCALALAFGSR